MRTTLVQAIADRNILSFLFRGSAYIVEPHAYGETSDGKEVLRCFQVGGDGQAWGWKLIPVEEVALFELGNRFNGTREGYAPGDRGMSKIFGQLGLESAALSPLAAPEGEVRWLIETSELGKNMAHDPKYPKRHFYTGDPDSQWHWNALEAARYPTKAAAEHVAEAAKLYPRNLYPVCDHMFQCGITPLSHTAPKIKAEDVLAVEKQPSSTAPMLEEAIKRAAEWVHLGAPKDEIESTIRDVVKMALKEAGIAVSAIREPMWQPGEPRVVCAALKDTNGRIVTGARHFDGVMMEQIKRGPAVDDWRGAEQGFIDQKGNFLTREEAHEIASRHRQILRRVGSDEMSLFSENLY